MEFPPPESGKFPPPSAYRFQGFSSGNIAYRGGHPVSGWDAPPNLPRPPALQWKIGGAGIFTSCPSPAPCGYGLGPDLPYAV